MRVFCVLRSGGDFDSEDVAALQVGVERHLSGARLNCLSDVEVPCTRVPLKYDWPGWWSKMELFRPDVRGDILFFDLDTVIVGDLSELSKTGRSTMADDFFFPWRPCSTMMYLTEADRVAVWETWITDPTGYMNRCKAGGDQRFLAEQPFGKSVRRWQKDYPGQVISFKVDMRPPSFLAGSKKQLDTPPANTRVVCFHGVPRPKQVDEQWRIDAQTSREFV